MSFTLWFTGLSGSGKTTLSSAVYMEIRRRGLKAELLDGDLIRRNIGKGLTYSREDRNTNVRRIGFIAYLLNRNDVVSVVAAIAPYAESREANSSLIDRYVEVYCECPLDVLEERDPKGLYTLARRGDIPYFTGVSDPYYPPESPDITIQTGSQSVDQSVATLIQYLEDEGLIPLVGDLPTTIPTAALLAQENLWRLHLCKLGYLKKSDL